MATASRNVADIANTSFSETLKCSICLDILKSPKALTCLHTFCEECIQANINAASGSARQQCIVCPQCRQQTKPPKNSACTEWAKQLPTNWPVVDFIERLTNHVATAVVPESDGEVDGQRSIDHYDLAECQRIEMCPMHSGKTLEFYCKDHSAILCKDCRNTVHQQGCSIVKIESLAQETAVAETAASIRRKLGQINHQVGSTVIAMKNNIEIVRNTVDNFQLRLLKLQKDFDLFMNEMHFELADTKFRNQTKARFTSIQNTTISECDSLQEAMRFSTSELDVIQKYGTPVQRFIAVERFRRLIPIFKKAADDNARSAKCVEIRHEGIEVLDSITRMKKEMKSVQGVGVNLADSVSD